MADITWCDHGGVEEFGPTAPEPPVLPFDRRMREEFDRLVLEHQFAVDEVLTKVSILQREFLNLHNYNPIEHVSARVKSLDSILLKVLRKGLEPTAASVRANLTDIAGLRITCSFIADTYRVLETLTSQDDLTVISTKDYIANPKPNGYRSIHAILEVPVYLSSGPTSLRVEVQLRTIAMDFWASLEHKIYYKYDGEVPEALLASLTDAASIAEQLDLRMAELYTEVHGQGGAQDRRRATEAIDAAILQRLQAQPRRSSAEHS